LRRDHRNGPSALTQSNTFYYADNETMDNEQF
jgi:hypothetical protein